MSKGLEALKDLYKLRAEMLEEKVCHKDNKWQENIKIYDRWGDNLILVEKELKALEIIKCLLFSKCRVYETSEKATATTITKGDYYVVELELTNKRYYLSKEEYDLLKEVLL